MSREEKSANSANSSFRIAWRRTSAAAAAWLPSTTSAPSFRCAWISSVGANPLYIRCIRISSASRSDRNQRRFESRALSQPVAGFLGLSWPSPKRAEEARNCATNWRSFSLTRRQRAHFSRRKPRLSRFISTGRFRGSHLARSGWSHHQASIMMCVELRIRCSQITESPLSHWALPQPGTFIAMPLIGHREGNASSRPWHRRGP